MQLNVLERFDTNTANAILAAAALSQEDTPYVSASGDKFATEVAELLAELERRLHLSLSDADGKKKIHAFLAEHVRSAILNDRSVDDIRQRQGQRGALPITAYKLKIDKADLKLFKESAKTVEGSVRSADEVQHFAGSGPFNDKVTGSTFITKWVSGRGGEGHWLFLDTQRNQDRLDVQSILRISPTRLDLSTAMKPLDLLRIFVERYGVEFSVEGLAGEHKFICDTEVLGNPKEYRRKIISPNQDTSYFETGYNVDKMLHGQILQTDCRIVVGYALDIKKYLAEKPTAY